MALSKWFLCGSEDGAGGGFEKDEKLAYTFAEKAAKKGLPSAEFAMGYYKEVGVGGPRDIESAVWWYTKVCLSPVGCNLTDPSLSRHLNMGMQMLLNVYLPSFNRHLSPYLVKSTWILRRSSLFAREPKLSNARSPLGSRILRLRLHHPLCQFHRPKS
jgi:hypothetical protein